MEEEAAMQFLNHIKFNMHTFCKSYIYVLICILKKQHFVAPFYGWGSTASRLEPLQGGSLLLPISSQKFLVLIY